MNGWQGVYYGAFPGDKLSEDGAPSSVWVVSRPHNWKPKSTTERLLELDMKTGKDAGLCSRTLSTHRPGMLVRSRIIVTCMFSR